MNNLNKEVGKPLTPPKSFFKWCESQIPTYQWSNKEKTILASERKGCEVIKKRLTKNSRLSYPTKFYPFAIILVSKNRIEIQSHDYWREIKDGKETLTRRMINFERFSNSQHLKASVWNGDWHKGLQSNYGFMSGAYTKTEFYPNNWREKLKSNKDLKYLDIPNISRHELPRLYKYRNQIEYLQNIKATNLANQVIFAKQKYVEGSFFSEVDMKVITKNWLKKHKAILKKDNPLFFDIMFEELRRKNKMKIIEGSENILHYKQFKMLPKEVRLSKFQTYYLKQGKPFRYYMDYLHMTKELNIPLDNDYVIFPKDLKKAHDNLVETLNLLRQEELRLQREKQRLENEKQRLARIKQQRENEENYKKRFKELAKFEQEIDEFVFLVPKDLQEIISEGNSLHHCVGSSRYLKAHSKGKTNIIFIRKKEDIETPFFTLEYQNKHIEQVQGKYDEEKVPNNLQKAIDKWEQVIKQVS